MNLDADLIEANRDRLMRPDESGGPKAFQRKDGSWGANFDVTAEAVRFLTPKGDAPDSYVPF